MAKLCKVLAVALCISFSWQQLHAQEAANTNPVPALSPEQLLKDAYDSAKFLSIVDTAEKINYTNRELTCLAKNIYYEAGHETQVGKLAVAQVTINRTQSPKFANSICGVVLAPNQFNWASNKKTRLSLPKGAAWEDCLKVAQQALDGKRVKGIEHALYFHASVVHPHWARLIRLAQIGTQIFYG
jgi:spore germination cell wall hydrolase CwlJ-like protein